MAYDHATRKRVRAEYVKGLPLTSAADVVGVPYNTARNWKRQAAEDGDDWDIVRNAHRMTKSGLEEMANQVLAELAQQFMATIDAIKKDKKMKSEVRARIYVQLMDGYAKAVAASTRALPHSNRLAVAMDVIRFLTGIFTAKYPKLRPLFVHAVEQLGPDLAKEFGDGR